MRSGSHAPASDHLPVLYRLGKLVTASLDVDATLGAIVDAARELSGADSTAIMLEDTEVHSSFGFGRGTIAGSVGERVSAQSSLAGRALRSGHPVRVDDMLDEAHRARPDLDQRSRTRSYVAAPLIWGEARLGVVTVGSAQPSMFADEAVQLVAELAQHAAVAVALTDMGQLVDGLAHELNAPLSVLIANLSVLSGKTNTLAHVALTAQNILPRLMSDPLSAAHVAPLSAALDAADLEYTLADLQELLSESTTASNRVAELVRNMGNFARRDTGGPKVVDIHDILEAAFNLASNQLKQFARIEQEYGDIPPVRGLRSELIELFVHLLVNAEQAIEDKPGTVTVSTSTQAHRVMIMISDTGRGVSAEHLRERHGGSIRLDSRPGIGTPVKVELPAAGRKELAA